METTELTRAEQERLLNSAIHQAVKEGWQLQHSTGTAASLKLPKPPSAFGANLVLTIITFGLWLIVWGLMIAVMPVRRERSLYIEVLPDGTVERTTDGLFGSTTRDGTHAVSEPANQETSAKESPKAGFQAAREPSVQEKPAETGELLLTRGAKRLRANEGRLELWSGILSAKLLRSLEPGELSAIEVTGFYSYALTIYGPDGAFLRVRNLWRGQAERLKREIEELN